MSKTNSRFLQSNLITNNLATEDTLKDIDRKLDGTLSVSIDTSGNELNVNLTELDGNTISRNVGNLADGVQRICICDDDTNLSKIPVQGTNTMVNSMPVTVSSDQTAINVIISDSTPSDMELTNPLGINIRGISGLDSGSGVTDNFDTLRVVLSNDYESSTQTFQNNSSLDATNIHTVLKSDDRASGTEINGSITLATALKSGIYKVKEFTMINNLYNVTTNNNKIYFDETAILKTGTLTSGFYIASDLITNIQDAMDLAGGNTYTITHDDLTNKFTFSSSGNFGFAFSSNTASTSRFLLGMNASDVAESTSDISDFPIRLCPNKSFYLKFPTCSTYDNLTLSNNNTTNIRISSDALFGDIIRNKFDDVFISFDNLTAIDYRLHDENDTDLIADDNGLNWEMSLINYVN